MAFDWGTNLLREVEVTKGETNERVRCTVIQSDLFYSCRGIAKPYSVCVYGGGGGGEYA